MLFEQYKEMRTTSEHEANVLDEKVLFTEFWDRVLEKRSLERLIADAQVKESPEYDDDRRIGFGCMVR